MGLRKFLLTAALLGLCVLGCSSDDHNTTGTNTTPTAVRVVSGSDQVGLAGLPLPQLLVAQVVDGSGNGFRDVWVRFAAAGGTITPDSARSDNQGRVHATWVLPVVAGSYISTATASGLTPATFSATVSSQNAGQTTQTIGNAGGTLSVGFGAGSARLTIPAGIISAPATVSLEIQPVTSGQLPSGVQPLTPIVAVSGPPVQSDSIITLSIPTAGGTAPFAMAYEVDAATSSLRPILMLSSDSNSVTIGIRSLAQGPSAASLLASSTGVFLTVRRFLLTRFQASVSPLPLDTGFRPGTDDWEFLNLGSVIAPNGQCLGQTLSMAWYYSERRRAISPSVPLNNAFSRIPSFTEGWEYDNRLGWRLASVVQRDQNMWLRNLMLRFFTLVDERSWRGLVDALKVTGKPAILAVWNTSTEAGHALLAWKVDESTGQIWIADPNHPGDVDRTIQYDLLQRRFNAYNGAQSSDAAPVTYDKIRQFPVDAADWDLIGLRWAEFDNGTIGTSGSSTFPIAPVTQVANGQSVALGGTIASETGVVALQVPGGYGMLPFSGSGTRIDPVPKPQLSLSLPTVGTRQFAVLIFTNVGGVGRIVDYVDFSISYAPRPTVVLVTPSTGPLSGGSSVTITGTNFFSASGATVGGLALTNMIVVNSTTITGTTPAASNAGAKDVVVTTSAGTSAPCVGCFTYTVGSQAVVTVAATDADASEIGPDGGTFTVTRTGSTAVALPVTFTLTGTATNGTDYVSVNTSLTIPAGQSSAAVQINPLADALVDGDETVILSVAAGAYSVGVPNVATVIIADGNGASGTLTNGANRSGAILTPGELDTFTFAATQGEAIVVSIGEVAPTADFWPWIRLVSPTGAIIGNSWNTAAAEIQANAPSSGTYTVIVGSNDSGNDGTGNYLLTVVRAPGTIVISAGDEGGPLTNGATHAGSVYLGDMDPWTFTATQGEAIAVSIGEVAPNANFSPWVRLVTPTGTVIGNSWNTAAAEIQANAPSTGTYTVIVGSNDSGNDGTGNYRLTVVKAPGTVVISAGDEGGPLSNGATHPGSTYQGDLDPWSFSATQGETIVVSIGEVAPNADFAPWIRLVSPTGTVIGNTWNTMAVEIQANAPTTGTYTVIVGSNDSGNDGSGNYLLTVVKAPGTFVISPGDEGGPVTNGATHAGSIYQGDMDPWSFTATQGEAIVVSIGEVAPNADFTPWIRLVSPTGAIVALGWGVSAGEIQANAPTTGAYTVIVGSLDSGNDGTGNYLLTVVKAPGTIVISAGDEGGLLTNGATHAGNIYQGDMDPWTFTATQGEAIVVSIGEVAPTADFAPWIRLVSSTGTIIGNSWNTAAAEIQANAPSTGTYTVIVGSIDSGNDGTGSYLLTVIKAPGTIVISAGDEGGPLTNGATHAGSIYQGDMDPWSFTATQGEAIAVSVGEVAPNADFAPWVRLVSPTGTILGNSWNTAAAEVQANAPSTGTYTVIIGSNDSGNDGSGSYLLTVVKAPGIFVISAGDEGGPLFSGANHAGSIYQGDLDPWSFTATQGEAIVVSIGEVAPNADFSPWIRLVSPTGAIIGNTWNTTAAQIQVTAPASGTYTVMVGSNDSGHDGTGNYILTLAGAPDTFDAPTSADDNPSLTISQETADSVNRLHVRTSGSGTPSTRRRLSRTQSPTTLASR